MKKFAKILILVLVCFLFLGFGCKKQNTAPAAVEEQEQEQNTEGILGFNNQDIETVFSKNLQNARTKLEYWDKNAQLLALNIDFEGDLEENRLNTTYIFFSNLQNSYNKYYNFAVVYNSLGQSIRTLVYKEDYLNNLEEPYKQVNTKYLKTSWLEAFKKAEEAGGKSFREKNPNSTKIHLSAYINTPGNYLYWHIRYSVINSDETFEAKINANTGELVSSQATDNKNSVPTSQSKNKANADTLELNGTF